MNSYFKLEKSSHLHCILLHINNYLSLKSNSKLSVSVRAAPAITMLCRISTTPAHHMPTTKYSLCQICILPQQQTHTEKKRNHFTKIFTKINNLEIWGNRFLFLSKFILVVILSMVKSKLWLSPAIEVVFLCLISIHPSMVSK